MITPRDYQFSAHDGFIEAFKKHQKPLLVAMAGSGKSITVGSFVYKYRKHFKFVLIVRKRDLVEQLAVEGLGVFGLDYSIFMAGHEKLDLAKSIQVCSKDTMDARDTLPFLGQDDVIVIVDEADEFKDYQKEIIKKYEAASNRFFYAGMTATPWNNLDQFDVVVEPITPKELLVRKILVPYVYVVPKLINLDEVEIINGEWEAKKVIKKMNSPSVIKGCFDWWLKEGDNRQTMIFCTSKAHSKSVTKYINDYYGKEVCAHCDADTPKKKRSEVIADFKAGRLTFLSNIRLFNRGTNIVELGCIMDLAPTLRLNGWVQRVTRGSRANDFYNDCILLDLAGNCLVHGPVYLERPVDLTSKYKKTKADLDKIMMRVCEKCFRAGESSDFVKNTCPYCGFCNAPIEPKKLSKAQEKKIFMETASEERIEQIKMINDFKKMLWKRKNLGSVRYPRDIVREKAQFDMLKKYGVNKCLKIKKSIGLDNRIINKWENKNSYVPLGGMIL